MIYDVDSLLRIFVADCEHKGQCSSPSGDTAHQTGSGVTPECSLMYQAVTKIGHTLKPVLYNLKSQGPLKHAKNIAEM